MLFVRHTYGTLLLFFLQLNFNGKKPKAKSRATAANKKTRQKKSPKAKLHNTSYETAPQRPLAQTKAVSHNKYYVK